MRSAPCPSVLLVAFLASIGFAAAECPPGTSVPITSGDPAAGPPVILTGLGVAPRASFFLLGQGDQHNSGGLTAGDFLLPAGDVDGDGLPDWRVEAPGTGPGGWGDARAVGCPALASPAYPPLVLLIFHDREDFDGDGKFDVFEDVIRRNGRLDLGEDLDGDMRLTPPDGCEGVLREDIDCDGRPDTIDEDRNHNGILDPGEDIDSDGRLDPGTEDRNHNQFVDDRPDPAIGNETTPDEQGRFGRFYPYGESRPSPGGIIVISLAWNGSAYNLQALNTPTEIAGAFRLVAPALFDTLRPRAEGARIDPQGTLRMSIGGSGVTLNDDAGGGRAIFDAALLDFRQTEEAEITLCGEIPCLVCGVSPCVPLFPSFATNGLQTLRVPSAPNLSFEAFTSIVPSPTRPVDVGPLRVRALSAGSDSFLEAHWPAIPLPNLLDDDFDANIFVSPVYPLVPVYSPMDSCPHRRSPANFDTNHDGIGNFCDPADPGSMTDHIVPNRWTSVAAGPSPGARSGAASVLDT